MIDRIIKRLDARFAKFNAKRPAADYDVALIERLVAERNTLQNTLTRCQARGTFLLTRARVAEHDRDLLRASLLKAESERRELAIALAIDPEHGAMLRRVNMMTGNEEGE